MPIIGTQQSPIRIVLDETIRANLTGHLAFHYDHARPGIFKDDNFVFDLSNNSDGTEDVTGKTMTAGGKDWVIRKIHIHAHAEHVVVQYAEDRDDFEPLEAHLVHSRPGDLYGRREKLVVGVFFTIVTKLPKGAKGRKSLYALEQLLVATAASGKTRCTIEHPHDINPHDFLPEDKTFGRFYRYEGSLTSEPFSEDVSWYVMAAEAHLLEGKVDQLKQCAQQEARPPHGVDRRFVLKSF